jgi:hypothetical protein
MRNASFLIGFCLILALALNGMAVQRDHSEIMQAVSTARRALQASIEGGNGAVAAMEAQKLEGLFREALSIYQEMNLEPAVKIASKAAAAAAEAVAAANANNLEAAGTAHGSVQKACGNCHSQFREKAPDGSFRFKSR